MPIKRLNEKIKQYKTSGRICSRKKEGILPFKTSNVPNLVLIGIMVLNVVIAVAAVMFPAWKMGRENIIDEIRG